MRGKIRDHCEPEAAHERDDDDGTHEHAAGYALWRLLRAMLGHGPEGSDDTKDRVAGLESGIGYALLCATAVQIL